MSLERFFRPRSIALVGATDKSAWSNLVFSNFARLGYSGALHMVNRRGAPAHGIVGVKSCRDIAQAPDLAYIMLPTDAVEEALEDVAAAGIRNAMILSSGFAETGEAGSLAQDALVRRARDLGVRFLGPNSLGFINYRDATPVSPYPVPAGAIPGHVAIASQSGATAQVIAAYAAQQGLALSHTIATGNEADIDMASIVDFLVDDADTRVIMLFTETIKDPLAFRHAVRRAARAEKPVVVLKVGSSALATQLAQAHTGSVTGDDRIFDAVCERDAVTRVRSIEELVTTAAVFANHGGIDGGLAIVSISGGACEIIADIAETHGLELPAFSDVTLERLAAVKSSYGATFNPLDITGAAVSDPEMFATILPIVDEDPAIGLTACVYDLPRGGDSGDYYNPDMMACIGRGLREGARPGFLVNQAVRPLGAEAREIQEAAGIPAVIGGLDHAVRAFAAAQRWEKSRRNLGAEPVADQPSPDKRPASERDVLSYLSEQGVQVPPCICATDADGAVAAWRAMGGPVVLKIASSAIQHKSDIGGVRLNLDEEDAIRAAFAEIVAAARKHHPDAPIDGCLVTPMRRGGVELFVGTAQSQWGPVIVAGLGGIWIEALDDTSLRLLPISPSDAREMLGELRGRRILDGYRGQPAVDVEAAAAAIARIGDAALKLGGELVSLEVNPLRADGSLAEPLDALAVWQA